MAAALAPRMGEGMGTAEAAVHAASMWPRLSRRGWGARHSLVRRATSLLQCGRGSRAADGHRVIVNRDRIPFGLQCGRGSRAADGRENRSVRSKASGASMWPRLSRRGWAGFQHAFTQGDTLLQCGRGSRAADGSCPCSTARRSSTRFNVAAALAPRMDGPAPAKIEDAKIASMWPRLSRRGWIEFAAEMGPMRCASMWPRLSRRGWLATVGGGSGVVALLQCGRGSRAADGRSAAQDVGRRL